MGRRRGLSASPVARLRKMMQSDDDVGKIATTTPSLAAKALECLIKVILRESANTTLECRSKTVTPQHLTQLVPMNDEFEFLRPVLGNVLWPGMDKLVLVVPSVQKDLVPLHNQGGSSLQAKMS